jgi:hypothetical protein
MTWDTYAEMDFINNLGTKNGGRLKALEGYMHGAKLRSNWGEINRKRIMKFVQVQIHIERKRKLEENAGA